MSRDFYHSQEYREKQSAIMKANWRNGLFDFHYKREKRVCARKECNKTFEVIISDPKIYCSRSCAAKINNVKRGPRPKVVKLKIAKALEGRESPFKGIIKVPRVKKVCANLKCKKEFLSIPRDNRQFCSARCSIKVIGGRPTSPKAARGKAGIRKDISKTIYFYSRWEANMARLFNFLDFKWIHQPKTFDLKSQTYTPDFYLPEYNSYIEVKNFLNEYSKVRDEKFRKIYPDIKLILILKKDYLVLEEKYSRLIENWEYKNSPFPMNN